MKHIFYSIAKSKKGNPTIVLDHIPSWYDIEYRTRQITYVFLASGWVGPGFLKPSRGIRKALFHFGRKYWPHIHMTVGNRYTKWDDADRRKELRRTRWKRFKELSMWRLE